MDEDPRHAESPTEEDAPPPPTLVDGRFEIKTKIGSGSFGDIYCCVDLTTGENLAAKLERTDSKNPQLEYETRVLKCIHHRDSSAEGFPVVRWFGPAGSDYVAMVMTKLGPSLEDVLSMCSRRLSLKTVLQLAHGMLDRLEYLHSRHLIHRDIKPDNFLLASEESGAVFMIDFGLSKRYRDPRTLAHMAFRDGKSMTGTARYVSLSTHKGYEPSRRDDLESLGYVLIYLLRGSLPWQGLRAVDKQHKYQRIMEVKAATPIETLTQGMPPEFGTFIRYCRELRFDADPDYQYLRSLLITIAHRACLKLDEHFDWVTVATPKTHPSVVPGPPVPMPANTPKLVFPRVHPPGYGPAPRRITSPPIPGRSVWSGSARPQRRAVLESVTTSSDGGPLPKVFPPPSTRAPASKPDLVSASDQADKSRPVQANAPLNAAQAAAAAAAVAAGGAGCAPASVPTPGVLRAAVAATASPPASGGGGAAPPSDFFSRVRASSAMPPQAMAAHCAAANANAAAKYGGAHAQASGASAAAAAAAVDAAACALPSTSRAELAAKWSAPRPAPTVAAAAAAAAVTASSDSAAAAISAPVHAAQHTMSPTSSGVVGGSGLGARQAPSASATPGGGQSHPGWPRAVAPARPLTTGVPGRLGTTGGPGGLGASAVGGGRSGPAAWPTPGATAGVGHSDAFRGTPPATLRADWASSALQGDADASPVAGGLFSSAAAAGALEAAAVATNAAAGGCAAQGGRSGGGAARQQGFVPVFSSPAAAAAGAVARSPPSGPAGGPLGGGGAGHASLPLAPAPAATEAAASSAPAPAPAPPLPLPPRLFPAQRSTSYGDDPALGLLAAGDSIVVGEGDDEVVAATAAAGTPGTPAAVAGSAVGLALCPTPGGAVADGRVSTNSRIALLLAYGADETSSPVAGRRRQGSGEVGPRLQQRGSSAELALSLLASGVRITEGDGAPGPSAATAAVAAAAARPESISRDQQHERKAGDDEEEGKEGEPRGAATATAAITAAPVLVSTAAPLAANDGSEADVPPAPLHHYGWGAHAQHPSLQTPQAAAAAGAPEAVRGQEGATALLAVEEEATGAKGRDMLCGVGAKQPGGAAEEEVGRGGGNSSGQFSAAQLLLDSGGGRGGPASGCTPSSSPLELQAAEITPPSTDGELT